MLYIYWGLVLLVICFSGVILFGAPYVPTLSKSRKAAFELLDLKKGQTILEPGCGDGRILVEAAKRGLNAVGIELNPLLYLTSLVLTFRYRKQVKVIWGNFWTRDWPETDGVFVFLLDKYMDKFDNKIKSSQKTPTKIASFAFKIPGKKPVKEKNGVFLYEYK